MSSLGGVACDYRDRSRRLRLCSPRQPHDRSAASELGNFQRRQVQAGLRRCRARHERKEDHHNHYAVRPKFPALPTPRPRKSLKCTTKWRRSSIKTQRTKRRYEGPRLDFYVRPMTKRKKIEKIEKFRWVRNRDEPFKTVYTEDAVIKLLGK